jgi:hypothetical protein
MKHQCPICRSWNEIPTALTLSETWSRSGERGFKVYSLKAQEGPLIAEVWQNIEYDDDHKRRLTDWHWQYNPVDRCCGALPGGNAESRAAAMQAAVAAFQAHCDELRLGVAGTRKSFHAGPVIQAACTHHGVSISELMSTSRSPRLASARWSAMMALREVGGWSLPNIANALCLRNHTTVLKGIRSAHDRMQRDPAYRNAVAMVRQAAIEAQDERAK